MNNIGCKLIIDDFENPSYDINLPSHIELKVNKFLLNDYNLKKIIQFLSENNIKFSFHLPKSLLYDKSDFNTTMKFIKFLSKIKYTNTIHLIFHFKDTPLIKEKKLNKLFSLAPENCIFLLENIVTHYDDQFINDLQNFFNLYENYNIKFCLDIGHLLFSKKFFNISDKSINILLKNVKSKIFEFHIHNFNESKDHLMFHSYDQIFEFFNLIYLLNSNCPIILESKHENFNQLEQELKNIEKWRKKYETFL